MGRGLSDRREGLLQREKKRLIAHGTIKKPLQKPLHRGGTSFVPRNASKGLRGGSRYVGYDNDGGWSGGVPLLHAQSIEAGRRVIDRGRFGTSPSESRVVSPTCLGTHFARWKE